MSISESFLSSAKYGYDFVVATTQESINNTMMEYLADLESSEVVRCYIQDAKGNPQLIEHSELVKQAKGSDPFKIPDNSPAGDQDLKNLNDVYFWYAFKASIGYPNGYAPFTPNGPALPPIVTLGSDTSSVKFNLTCANFQIVQLNVNRRGAITGWMNKSQPDGKAWIFQSKVDLRMATVGSDYSKLPKAVQGAIKNLGPNAFSIQQLLFDLDNAALETMPTIEGAQPGTPLYSTLQEAFLGAYFSQIKTNGQPGLNYSVVHSKSNLTSSLSLTDLNMEVSPYLNGQNAEQAATLCYLCATDGNSLPAPVPFSWNWVDWANRNSYNGAVSINKNTFRDYLLKQLQPSISRNSYQPEVKVVKDGLKTYFSFNLINNQAATITKPDTGATVLKAQYENSANDQAGLDGWMGSATLSTSYYLNVIFSGNTITIDQQLVVYVKVKSGFSSSGNIIDKQIMDHYTLSVDDQGELAVKLATHEVDNSQKVSFDSWYDPSSLETIAIRINKMASDIKSSNLTNIPVSIIQNFVFPGGKSFTYQDVEFSANQDLTSYITYAQPN